MAIRKADQQLILRDTAQTAKEEMTFFTDEHRHPYFHTNNLWFDLQALARTLDERKAVLGLPMIKNVKTVDPSDPSSTEVVQIESAMGAAIEVFPGATAIGVGRERFLPVKTTNDLLVLRSDVYAVAEDGRLVKQDADAPLVDLDGRYYKTIAGFERRFAAGAPSLQQAIGLTVEGDWTFQAPRHGGGGRHPSRCRGAADGAGSDGADDLFVVAARLPRPEGGFDGVAQVHHQQGAVAAVGEELLVHSGLVEPAHRESREAGGPDADQEVPGLQPAAVGGLARRRTRRPAGRSAARSRP